ncbi:hypothetical protein VNO77_09346 [Canavalia gladiata]|uniref:DOMON domain-containing protein n=1 Tax=Canavalia gladiata TaxID=3824 RepID=A0AAN9MFT3_CANGL
MASHLPFFSPFILGTTLSFIFFFSLLTPSHSALDCASQKLPPNRTYTNCTNLPSLGATLHFTYNTTNNSLAVAFAAAPPKSDGWVAWGINPAAGGGMIGAQALIAHKQNGTVAVNLYNLTAYKGIDKVKALSFETWDISAEDANGVITIFAVVKVPEKAENLSQVWQVGPVTGGRPSIHETKTENLQAKGALQVVGTTSGESGNSNTNGGDHKSGGISVMGERFGFGFYFGGLVLVFMSFFTM